MNFKKLITLLIFCFLVLPANCEEDIDTVYLSINEAPNGIKGAIEEVKEPVKAKVEYNAQYQTSPLLKKYTDMTFERGFVETFKPSLVYQGDFNFNFVEHEGETTLYENALLDLNLAGKFKAPIEYKFQYNLLGKGHVNYMSTFFKDQYLTFNYIPHHKIYVGRYKPSIGVEGCGSNYTLSFISLSQLAKNFSAVRSFGTKIEGNYDLVDYNIGIGSSDRKLREFFPGVEVYNWVNFKPLGKTDGRWGELKIGGGINAGKLHDNYFVASTGASYKYKRFDLSAEYGISEGSNGSKGYTKNRAQGANVTASYYLTEKLQLLACYDIFDADRQKSGKTTTEYTAGINWYIKGSSLKLMLNYTYTDKNNAHNSNKILVGTQIIL